MFVNVYYQFFNIQCCRSRGNICRRCCYIVDKCPHFPQEFLREARVMSGLNHPCIVKLLGVCLGPPLILVSNVLA